MEHIQLYNSIFRRKSIRKYLMTPLAADIMIEIKSYINNVIHLDDSIEIDFSYLDTKDVKKLLPIKAPHYICVYSEKADGYLMNIGFILQQIDLYLSARGIGSCWLGTAKPTKVVLKRKNELDFVIMLAFGNSDGPVWREELSEFKRKELDNISTAKKATKFLSPVRLAPSATNSQPWFFTGDNQLIHLHRIKLNMIKAPLYDKMNQIDMGIAMCHLYLSVLKHHKEVKFITTQIDQNQVPKGYEYIISAQINSQ